MGIANYWQVFAEGFVERVTNSMVEGIAIALFGWILLRALGRQNSSTRFAVWFSAMVAIAALPLFENSAAGNAMAVHSAFRLPGIAAVYVFVLWAAVAGVGLARIALGFWRLRQLRRSCTAIDSDRLDPVVRDTLSKFSSRRNVALEVSERVRVPVAIGFLKPAIIIPKWALEELPALELNAVLLHEFAHLQRWDDWTNLAQRVLSALLFFHPAVWCVGRGLSREREMACDDFVLAATSDPRTYAQCLVTVAEKSLLHRGLAMAQAAVGRMQQTAHRVARILNGERPTATVVWKPAFGLVSAVSIACLISMPHAPRLIAFEATAYRDSESAFSASAGTMTFPPAADSAPAGAKIIPTPFHGQASATSKQLDRRHDKRFPVSTATAAKFVQRQAQPPRVINAAAHSSTDDVGEPRSVLLVVHTQQVDEYGRVWSICVWRLTVFRPVDQEARKQITPKTT